MSSIKLTKRIVDASQSDGVPQSFIWDSELKGFGLRITPTRKTYIVQSRVGRKTVRITLGLHGSLTPDQARTEAKKRLGEMAKGINLNQAERDAKIQGITLKQAFDSYLQTRALTENTTYDYKKAMEKGFADWHNKPIQSIKREMIEARFNKLSERSHAQANQMFRFLRALLNFAKEKYTLADGEPLIQSNPCDRLTALKKWHRIDRRTSYIEPHQLKPWFRALLFTKGTRADRQTVRDFCAFVLLTGCREQEAAKLKWEDADLEAGTVTFKHTKNHRTHTLPMGSWLKNLIMKRYNEANSSYIFPANNKYGYVKNHRKSILSIRKRSKVEFTLHDLRRTFASIVNHQLTRSFSLYTIKRLLNHSGDVTAGYIQFGIEDLREPMQMIETYVLRCAGITNSSIINNPL